MRWVRRLAEIPAPWWGWFFLVAQVGALFLAVGSGFAWLAAGRAEDRAEARATEYALARDSMQTLLAGRWVRLGPWDRVYYGRAPGDTLPRAAR